VVSHFLQRSVISLLGGFIGLAAGRMVNYFKGNGPYPVLPANILKLYLNVGCLLDSNYAKIIFEKQEQSAFAYAVKK
jgi:hypothetical protein